MPQADATKRNHCTATRRDGQPCQAPARPGLALCWAHDPELAEQRKSARRQGGHNRAGIVRLRGLMPPRLCPIFDHLEQAMEEVHKGELTAGQAQAMASLARAMVDVLQAGEMEERLRQMEQAITNNGGVG